LFLSYSAANNGVTLKSGLEVVQGRSKWRRSVSHVQLTIRLLCNYSSILYHFQVVWR